MHKAKVLFRGTDLLRCLCLPNGGDVGNILRPSHGEFVCDEMLSGDISSAEAIDGIFRACLPGRVEIDALDILENINANRRNTKPENGIGFLEVYRRDISKGRPERDECGKDGLCIVRPPVNKNVEIFCCTRLSMNRYCMTANYDISHIMRVQSGQEFF